MNRLIKFRIWDIEAQSYMQPKKISVCPFGLFEAEQEETWYESKDNLISLAWAIEHPDKFSVEQWTGLVDTNGNDIYEGDIVKIYLDHEGVFIAHSVRFCKGVFIIGMEPTPLGHYYVPFYRVGISGNIHGNPDLSQTT